MKPVLCTFKSLMLVVFIFSFQNNYAQNVGISSASTFTPDASAALDVSFTNKGLLVPRVALTATNAAGPITSPATSLLVYNTATTSNSANNVVPGYYYWSGTAWVALVSGAQLSNFDWSLTGNTGTTAGNNFLGTTDATDFVMKTNNAERARIVGTGSTPGNFIVSNTGTTTLNSTNPEKLLVDAGTTSSFNVISGKGNLNNYLQLNIQNVNAGTGASSDVVASNDQGSESANFIDMGINSSANTSTGPIGGANTAYLYSAGSDFAIGNGAASRNLTFFTSGTATTPTYTERMRIDPSGNVGIGTASPTTKLSVAGVTAPAADATYNLGTSALRWNTFYYVSASQTSDRRMKTNIKPLGYGLKQVLALNPVSYNWKKTPSTNPKIGLIAQEVQKIIPEVVIGDETKETLGMNYAELVAVLINAIKEQQKQIDELKSLVNNAPKSKVVQLLHTGKSE